MVHTSHTFDIFWFRNESATTVQTLDDEAQNFEEDITSILCFT